MMMEKTGNVENACSHLVFTLEPYLAAHAWECGFVCFLNERYTHRQFCTAQDEVCGPTFLGKIIVFGTENSLRFIYSLNWQRMNPSIIAGSLAKYRESAHCWMAWLFTYKIRWVCPRAVGSINFIKNIGGGCLRTALLGSIVTAHPTRGNDRITGCDEAR